MNTHSKLARQLFDEGYNCSQAVLLAFSEETGMDKDAATKLALGFGLGMGLQEVCGAVTGMFMVASLIYSNCDPKDRASKAAVYGLINSLGEKYKEEYGSYICRDLLASVEPNMPRPCANLVERAAEMMSEYIESGKL